MENKVECKECKKTFCLEEKDRILVTDGSIDSEIKLQMDFVTDYAISGKEKNPHLFRGC